MPYQVLPIFMQKNWHKNHMLWVMVNLTEIQSEAHIWPEPSLFCQETCKQTSPVLKTQGLCAAI